VDVDHWRSLDDRFQGKQTVDSNNSTRATLNASDKIACKLDSGLKIEIELSFYLALSEITQLKNWATLTISSKNQEMSVFLVHVLSFSDAYRSHVIDKFDNIRANSNLGQSE